VYTPGEGEWEVVTQGIGATGRRSQVSPIQISRIAIRYGGRGHGGQPVTDCKQDFCKKKEKEKKENVFGIPVDLTFKLSIRV